MVAPLVTLEKILKKTLLRRHKHCMNIISKLLTIEVLLSWHTTRSSQTLWECRFEPFNLTFLLWHTLLTSWSSKVYCVKRLVHGFENRDVNAFSHAQSSSTIKLSSCMYSLPIWSFLPHTKPHHTQTQGETKKKAPKMMHFQISPNLFPFIPSLC